MILLYVKNILLNVIRPVKDKESTFFTGQPNVIICNEILTPKEIGFILKEVNKERMLKMHSLLNFFTFCLRIQK